MVDTITVIFKINYTRCGIGNWNYNGLEVMSSFDFKFAMSQLSWAHVTAKVFGIKRRCQLAYLSQAVHRTRTCCTSDVVIATSRVQHGAKYKNNGISKAYDPNLCFRFMKFPQHPHMGRCKAEEHTFPKYRCEISMNLESIAEHSTCSPCSDASNGGVQR